MIRYINLVCFLLLSLSVYADYEPEFSTAGFFRLADSGREVFSMNPAWRFYKGANMGAERKDFNDTEWTVVSLPHGIEYLPTEASGSINYQGEVWYRKHFTLDKALKGKKLFLHFEAIMGKCKVFVNGQLLTEHFGGYLPVIVDVTDVVDWNNDNVIAVWTDNSNDPTYPPGKPQDSLDFTYCGGIYRDCWLVAHNQIYVTNPNFENETAGGGLFVSYGKVSEKESEVNLKLHIRNNTGQRFKGIIEYTLLQPDGHQVAYINSKFQVRDKNTVSISDKMFVKGAKLWSPSTPTLYNLLVRILDLEGNVIDGFRHRIGIRSIEFKGKEGFWLNGKPYGKPLIGANRHQDFAVVGNAVANSIHWRDAKKLKDAGLEVIRNAHCPQDPAFMDACDELGLFVINNTPGWQFWNDEPVFEQRVYKDIHNLVRRDRNHACQWLWEPILNETRYPGDFAKNMRDIVDSEYPYPYSNSGCDSEANGNNYFDIHFAHPPKMFWSAKKTEPDITYFTREWGDDVDNWKAQNSPSRAARNWGEQPMLVQAEHYASPYYPSITCFEVLYQQTPQHVGGCLWHSFDHQRGYHPDPFYGGIMDVFRQPKYSYYMFTAQRPVEKNKLLIADNGPMVYIAHAMTPFSSRDVTVYSNCEEVRLSYIKGGKTYTYRKQKEHKGMPSPIITFPKVYDFSEDQFMAKRQEEDVYLLAEGLEKGQVVASHKVYPGRRPEKIILWLDNEKTKLKADGSDFVTVVAAIADKYGHIKRLNNSYISFSIEGEGRILGGKQELANPVPVKWGSAPVLIQSTLKPGKIRVKASVLYQGTRRPIDGELEFESYPSDYPLIYDKKEAELIP